MFATQNQRECFTSEDAERTYQKHHRVENCENGKGGHNAMNVYRITCPSPGLTIITHV